MVPNGPVIGPTPVPCVPGFATPQPSPTQPPIIVNPSAAEVVLGTTVTLRVQSAISPLTATPADPSIATVTIDQSAQSLAVTGNAIGTTTIHLSDQRGVARDIPVHVAYLAGSIASALRVRLTGDPATSAFVKGQVAQAVMDAALPRTGAVARAFPTDVNVRRDLKPDDLFTVDVPVLIEGPQYIPAQGTTHVTIENYALPRISPRDLLVSDFPETLKENGVLFTANLTREVARRFLYYHFNPLGQPPRRLLLKVENPAPEPAMVQFISGSAGPEQNEMEVGHLSTRRFLVREQQNEGTVVTIPGNTTINLVNQLLPETNTVSAILQLREVTGSPLKLTLLAQDSTDPVDRPVAQSAPLLNGDVPHARGVYPVPEFFYNYTWETSQDPLEIPIGTLKLPNLREGDALAGDYGVQQSITLTIVNNSPAPAPVALYESPRGGRATGTYIIDHVLVQAHAVAPYAHVKLREYTVPARGFVRVSITTMPEGGSSYPLLLVVGPDDGGTSPGAPNSPVY